MSKTTNLPNVITDQAAVKRRNNLIFAAIFFAVIGFAAFKVNATEPGMVLGAVAGVLLSIAKSIKTKRHLQGGTAIYK